ncbi:MAG: hypothetical protein IT378_16190 [Sandaracinaceae bacterium]|nr:hypothetical protein [Sandaracinaceae bacterium]
MALVEQNLARFERYAPNEAMVARLRDALAAGRRLTGADASFYLHEVAEGTFRTRGVVYDMAHALALEKYGASPFGLYHPEVIRVFPKEFSYAWREFWGLR